MRIITRLGTRDWAAGPADLRRFGEGDELVVTDVMDFAQWAAPVFAFVLRGGSVRRG